VLKLWITLYPRYTRAMFSLSYIWGHGSRRDRNSH